MARRKNDDTTLLLVGGAVGVGLLAYAYHASQVLPPAPEPASRGRRRARISGVGSAWVGAAQEASRKGSRSDSADASAQWAVPDHASHVDEGGSKGASDQLGKFLQTLRSNPDIHVATQFIDWIRSLSTSEFNALYRSTQ